MRKKLFSLQFSFRSLLVMMTIVALTAAYVMRNRHIQIEAIRTIEIAEGRVLYDWQPIPVLNPDGSIHYFRITFDSNDIKVPAWIRRWFGDELFQYVESVDYLHPNEIDDNVLAAIDTLHRLKRITLYNDPQVALSDVEVKEIKEKLVARYQVKVYGPFDYPIEPKKCAARFVKSQ